MMDAIDMQIASLLRTNARTPLKTIAAKVNLARSTVRERLVKLEETGIILGYHARVADTEKLSALLLLKLAKTPAPRTVAAITALPDVCRCYSLSGDIDLAVEIEARATSQLNATRDLIATLPDVIDVTTSLILKRDKDV
jgi:Lrp/AsnC family transcriptional regulator, leucine-responsive regulatory protein